MMALKEGLHDWLLVSASLALACVYIYILYMYIFFLFYCIYLIPNILRRLNDKKKNNDNYISNNIVTY